MSDGGMQTPLPSSSPGMNYCAYCGKRCHGYGCKQHKDLAWLDPRRHVHRPHAENGRFVVRELGSKP